MKIQKSKSKYKNKPVTVDNIRFASQHEAQRYKELCLLQKAGKIKNLRLQVPYELIPAHYELVDGKKKCIERAVKYVADFVYRDTETGETVVEDTKGVRTKEYILKRKMMLHTYGIRIKEV